MSTLRVIYTQDADQFRFPPHLRMTHPIQGNEFTNRIRARYARLAQEVDLPERVGVVTYDEVMKPMAHAPLHAIENPTTTFTPLDVFERVLQLRDEDLTNPLAENYVYRTLSFEFIKLAPVLSEKQAEHFSALCVLPSNVSFIRTACHTIEEIERQARSENERRQIADLRAKMQPLAEQDGWRFMDAAYARLLSEFAANRVSREFPLHYSMNGEATRPPRCSLVDVSKGVERLEPALWNMDRYGETRDLASVDALMDALPMPRTIITDIYLISHFPHLAQGLETYEHALPDKPKNVAELLQEMGIVANNVK